MGRPKKQEQPPEPEDISQEEPETSDFHSEGGKPRSQADMVRAALAEGHESPSEAVQWIKRQFQFDMKTTSFSATKAQIKHRSGGTEATPRTPTPSQSSGGIPSGFGSDVKELRALMEKAGGADELNELIGQLSGLIGKYGASGLSEIIEAIG